MKPKFQKDTKILKEDQISKETQITNETQISKNPNFLNKRDTRHLFLRQGWLHCRTWRREGCWDMAD